MEALLDGKVAVVTGGSRGIGEAICLRFAENGAVVVVADIERERAEAVARAIRGKGGKADSLRLDVADIPSIAPACDAVVKTHGGIDIWVNNAGISQSIPIEDLGEADWDRLMDVDLKGVFFCSQAAFRIMKARRSGKIVNIGSLAGERGGRFAGAHYSAAKAGVLVLTKCFALNGGEHNINVNAIAPGLIDTQMAAELGFLKGSHADIPLGRLGMPRDVADTALYLASRLSDYITGMTVDINGGQFMR
jgi:3-oxoacyl-[acyl-carrier protein] reductase